jgi:hypothetical protein
MHGLKNVRTRRTDSLTRVAWDQLESLLAIYYRGQGYRVEHVGTAATGSRFDGGIDLKLYRDDQYIVVQCKHWNAKQVPHNDVHQLLGLMVNEGATGAILVTSGEFTRAASEAARKLGHVQLIDGDDLRVMLGPLPEPPVAAAPLDAVASGAKALATHAGERLLRAAEDRIRSGGRRGGGVGHVASRALLLILLKFALAGGVMVMFWLGMQGVIGTLQQSAARRAAAIPASHARPLPMPQSPGNGGVTQAATGNTVGSGAEVIDGYTGTTIEDTGRPARQPTPAEIRESQRKADEAMRVLEASTPEM